MMIKTEAIKSNPFLSLKLGGMGLLLVYLSIFLLPPGLVPHTEHSHLSQLTSSLENNPCHIAIYHPGVYGGCHHKFHLTAAYEDCPLCHVTLVRQTVPEPILSLEIAYSVFSCENYFTEGKEVYFPVIHDDRGPPIFTMI
jgi:hypothetical protein